MLILPDPGSIPPDQLIAVRITRKPDILLLTSTKPETIFINLFPTCNPDMLRSKFHIYVIDSRKIN